MRILTLGVILSVVGATAGQNPNHAPEVRLGALHVSARIVDGVATTELHQVVHNDGTRPAEQIWILPLPLGATADRFELALDGVTVAGEVLDAAHARRTYEAIVRAQRDPGLLEYVGRGCLRARIFPIPPQGEATVVVRYRQILRERGGLYQWTFPLGAPQMGSLRPEQLSVDLTIRTSRPIRSIFSPLHGVEFVSTEEHEARATLELDGPQLPDRDLSIFYGVSDDDIGMHLLTYRRPGQPGYFLLLCTPKRDWSTSEIHAKSIQFVLDTSGSMQGAQD